MEGRGWKGRRREKGRGREKEGEERRRRRRREGEVPRRHRDANPMAELAFLPRAEHICQEIWEGFKDTAELGGSWKMLSIATC